MARVTEGAGLNESDWWELGVLIPYKVAVSLKGVCLCRGI